MSYASATGAQRLAVNSAAEKLAKATYAARHGLNGPGTAGFENAETAGAACSTALAAVGIIGTLPANQVVVTNGATINVENSAGALDSPATAVVAGGVLTGCNLAATKTILTHAVAVTGVTITGSGTTFTPTIVAGVLTGGVLS